MDNRIIPTEYKSGTTYSFGVKNITPKEQRNMIISAMENHSFKDNFILDENHLTFEGPGHYGDNNGPILPEKRMEFLTKFPAGYCANDACMGKCDTKAVRSVYCGNYASHHCLTCLSNELVTMREICKVGAKVTLIVTPIGGDTTAVVPYPRKKPIQIRFEGSLMVIDNLERYPNYVWTYHNGNPVIQLTADIHIKGRKRLCGEYPARLTGRKACQNIILGKVCKSFHNETTEPDFINDTVPAGCPAWKEEFDKKANKWRITVHAYCRSCFDEKTMEDVPDPRKVISKQYKRIAKLEAENRELRLRLQNLPRNIVN